MNNARTQSVKNFDAARWVLAPALEWREFGGFDWWRHAAGHDGGIPTDSRDDDRPGQRFDAAEAIRSASRPESDSAKWTKAPEGPSSSGERLGVSPPAPSKAARACPNRRSSSDRVDHTVFGEGPDRAAQRLVRARLRQRRDTPDNTFLVGTAFIRPSSCQPFSTCATCPLRATRPGRSPATRAYRVPAPRSGRYAP